MCSTPNIVGSSPAVGKFFGPRAGGHGATPDEVATTLGRHDIVRELLAMVSADPTDRVPPYPRAQRLRFHALLDATTNPGNSDVEADLQTAITALGDLGYPYSHARAQLDLAAWSIGNGKGGQAEMILEEARLWSTPRGPTTRRKRGSSVINGSAGTNF